MNWNWEQEDWPNFSYDTKELEALEREFLKHSGELLGALKYIDADEKEQLKIELISDEALKTSEIEDEILDRDSLQSSIRQHFGLKTDGRKVPLAEQGIAAMTVDLYKCFSDPLTKKRLCDWHGMLMNGRTDLSEIGCYRTGKEAMQVVSGTLYKRKVHYEAPPSDKVPYEMEKFIEYFNATAPGKSNELPALIRAAIAHWYFFSIHPFEDGNGRISRALSEYALAQSLGYPTLISLSYTIERERKKYYDCLEKQNKTNEITKWLTYFGKTIVEAQNNTQKRVEFLIAKTRLLDHLKGQLNARQEKALLRMFKEGIDGFKGGLSADNYISITGTSTATASRDLKDLVDKEALIKTGQLRHTRYYLNI